MLKQHRIAKERNDERVLVVEAGQVVCPRQGNVDMERCWVCPAYGGLSSGHIEGVVCEANLEDLRFDTQSAIR